MGDETAGHPPDDNCASAALMLITCNAPRSLPPMFSGSSPASFSESTAVSCGRSCGPNVRWDRILACISRADIPGRVKRDEERPAKAAGRSSRFYSPRPPLGKLTKRNGAILKRRIWPVGWKEQSTTRAVAGNGDPAVAGPTHTHGSGLGRWRWVVERTFAWLNQFRRLRVRYEKRTDILEAFLVLGCTLICWRFLASEARLGG